MSVEWDYYDKFDSITDKYMLSRGEGETLASQIVTAVNKLVYKWYNDGDIYDNTATMREYCNDLSSYANWLYEYTTEKVRKILERVYRYYTDSDYEDILKALTDELLQEDYLAEMATQPKEGSIYKCDGPFEYVEIEEEYDDYDEDDFEDDEEDYED